MLIVSPGKKEREAKWKSQQHCTPPNLFCLPHSRSIDSSFFFNIPLFGEKSL